MYSGRWSPGLRQGDIVGKIPFPLPAKHAQFVSGGAATGLGLVPQMTVVPAISEYAAIVSHDCEFTERKRKHFLIARIDDLPSTLTPEQLEELRLGNDVEESLAAGRRFPLDTFVLEPLDGVFDRPRRINFCTITPYSMAGHDELRELKKAEIDHSTRVLLRTKLGLFFAREAADIPDGEKSDAPSHAAAEPGDAPER